MAPPGRRTIILSVAFLLAIALTFVFGYRAGRHARMFRRESQPVRGWMSVPFIAHTHHVPADVLYHAIGEQPRPKDHRPLFRIAREQKRKATDLINEVNTALQQNGAPVPPQSPEHKTP